VDEWTDSIRVFPPFPLAFPRFLSIWLSVGGRLCVVGRPGLWAVPPYRVVFCRRTFRFSLHAHNAGCRAAKYLVLSVGARYARTFGCRDDSCADSGALQTRRRVVPEGPPNLL